MQKPEYKILIAKDGQGSIDYGGWLKSDRLVNFQIQEFIIDNSEDFAILSEEILKFKADCIVCDLKAEVLAQLNHLDQLSVPIIILVSEEKAIAGLNSLFKGTLTKELLSSTICHQISQAKLQQKLIKAEATLKEHELLKYKLQLEQSVNLLLQSIHSSVDLSTIFTAATTGIGKLLKLDRVEITQYFPEQAIWKPIIEYREHLGIPTAIGTVPDYGDQISNKLKQGEIVAINSDLELSCNINQALLEEYPGSWLIVPIVVGSSVWGALSLDNQRVRPWLEVEIELAVNVSTQLAIAIQQSNSHQKLQSELIERKSAEIFLKLAERNLKESENRYRQIVNIQKDFVMQSLANTTIIFANESLCTALGLTSNQIFGKKWSDFVPSEELPNILSSIATLNPQDSSFLMENQDQRANQKIGWTQWINQGIFNQSGQLIEVHSVGRDITALKQAEAKLKQLNQELENRIDKRTADLQQSKEALKRSEELLRLTIENTPTGILTVSLEGEFLTVNQDACRIFGYSAEELLKMNIQDITDPRSKEITANALHQVLSGELISNQIEKLYIHKSGKTINAICRIGIVRNEDGSPIHFVKGIEDITDRKQAEIDLNRQFERQNFIAKITQQIRQSLDLDEVLTTAVNEVNNLLKGDRVIIFQLFDNGSSQVVKEIVKPDYLSILSMNWAQDNFSPIGFDYYIKAQPRVINNVTQDMWADCLSEFMIEAKVKSKMVAPIIQSVQPAAVSNQNKRWQRQNSQLWGLLVVHSCGEYRSWQPEEADLLQQVANQLAIAIQQASLYQLVASELSSRNLLEQVINKKAAADRLLSEITISINQSFNLDRVLDINLQKVQKLLESDRVLIFQIGADGNGKVVKEAVSDPNLSILDNVISDTCFATTNLCEQYLNGKVTILEDVQTAEITPCYANLLDRFQIRSNLAVPIMHSGKLWGLLLVHQCHAPRVWLPHEINLIKQIGTQIGISAQKEKLYLRIRSELSQKEILLKEIHHRVKNNLQVMSSLLRLQFRKTTPEVKVLCEEYQTRIQSMALIHDQLHRSNDLANIDFYGYIAKLTSNLFQCYGINSDLVQLDIEVQDIFLPLDQSIPLGLIINELVSNALKYAFPSGYGKINVALAQLDHAFELKVADNGVGISEDLDLEHTDSLGMQLVYSLTDQLEGEVECDRSDGTTFHITFPVGQHPV